MRLIDDESDYSLEQFKQLVKKKNTIILQMVDRYMGSEGVRKAAKELLELDAPLSLNVNSK